MPGLHHFNGTTFAMETIEQTLYVQPDCKLLNSLNPELVFESESTFTFLDEFYAILNNEAEIPRSFVVLGDPGTGKTMLALALYNIFDSNYKSDNSGYFPVYISKDFRKIPEYNNSEVQKCLLLSDGLISTEGVVSFRNSITVYFLRKDMITNRDMFDSNLREIILPNFNDCQIEQYLHKKSLLLTKDLTGTLYEKTQETYKRLRFDYKKWIKKLPKLNLIAQNPFMLNLIVQYLPLIVSGNDELHRIQHQMMKILTDQWCQFHVIQFVKSEVDLVIEPESLINYCRANAINSAKYPNIENELDFLEPAHNAEFLSSNWSSDRRLFEKNPKYLVAVQSSKLPQFSHHPFLEYFAHSQLLEGILGELEFFIKPDPSISILDLNIVNDFSKLDELAKVLRNSTKFEKLLFEIIYATKDFPELKTLAAGAATLLNYVGVSFSGLDFCHIQIPGANLTHSLCGCTDFRGSNLRGVCFREAWLTAAKFEGANMNNVDIGIRRSHSYFKHGFPKQIEFWKHKSSRKVYMFVKYRKLISKTIHVCKVNSFGEIVKTFRMKYSRGSKGWQNKFQIFGNKLSIGISSKVTVFDLNSDKCIGTFQLNNFNDSINSRVDCSKFKTSFDTRNRPDDIEVKRIKFNSTGELLVSVSGYKQISVYAVNYGTVKLNLRRNIECHEGILAFHFIEPTQCVFLFLLGMAIVELDKIDNNIQILNFPSSFCNEFLIPCLESVLYAEKSRLVEPFVVYKEQQQHLNIAIFGDQRNVLIFGLVEGSSDLHLVRELKLGDDLDVMQIHIKLSTLVNEGNILVATCTNEHDPKQSTLLVWMIGNYELIHRESFDSEINETKVIQLCQGIYEIGIFSTTGIVVKTIEIQTAEFFNSQQIERNARFKEKFIKPEKFYDLEFVRISPDMKKMFAFTKPPELLMNEPYLPTAAIPRFLEIWDLETGRIIAKIKLLFLNYFLFIEWLRDDMIVIVHTTNPKACLYDYFGNVLLDWTKVPYSIKLGKCHKLKGFDDILIHDSNPEEIVLARFIISPSSITFEKIFKLFPKTEASSSKYFYGTVKHNRVCGDCVSTVRIWNLFRGTECPVFKNEYTEVRRIEVEPESQSIFIFKVNGDIIILNSFVDSDNLELTRQFSCSYLQNDTLAFEPKYLLGIKYMPHGVQILKFSKDTMTQILNLWVDIWIEVLHAIFLSEDKVLLMSKSMKGIACVQFCETDWKLLWGKFPFTNFHTERALFKNALNLDDAADRIIKVHGAEGIRSIPKEKYISKAELYYPIPGTSHMENVSKFTKTDLRFNETEWILSAVAVKTASSGIRRREHLALLCEGIVNCRRFTFRAELQRQGKYPFIRVRAYKSLSEIDEFIKEEKVNDKWVYFQQNISKDDGGKLIDSILLDRRNKYTTLGENCVKWVQDKLAVIGIKFRKRRRDWFAKRATVVQNYLQGVE